jgi:16S rRNA C967 or C1407 C5-methylase (RsmB/RsmF family)/NOL1/NOP2/fmu family ribosome biogenesis protein
MLPQQLLDSLQDVKGFDQETFEQVHRSGEQVTSIRINPAKPSALSPQPSALSPQPSAQVPWCSHGYYLNERPSFTLDPTFHAGAYYVQEASSMFLWETLKQTVGNIPNQKALDLCAAPGGKSTLLSSFFADGLVVSNEVIKSRATILVENISKWGTDNVVVTNNDPQHFQSLPNFFDVMVVDAPCSGSGLFRKDPAAIDEWSLDNVQLCSQRQQRILADALPALKQDGILIYSTCSYSKEEDESIADWLVGEMQMQSMKLDIPTEWNIVETISDKQNAYGYRFYPDKIKGEGFFIAAFKKTTAADDKRIKEQQLTAPSKQEMEVLNSFFGLPAKYAVFKQGTDLRAMPQLFMESLKQLSGNLYIKKAGVALGTVKGKDFVPDHELALSVFLSSSFPYKGFNVVELDKEQALNYLRRKDITINAPKGWIWIKYQGQGLGWAKVLPNRINNYYPQEWRILKA